MSWWKPYERGIIPAVLINVFHYYPYTKSIKHHFDVFAVVLLTITTLRWYHNGRDSVSNHQPRYRLLNRLFRRRSKKTSKLRVTGLCVGNSPGTGAFPAQMASNAENVSIWWRHHATNIYSLVVPLRKSSKKTTTHNYRNEYHNRMPLCIGTF